MKILTIVGARPQFIKAAMVSRAVIRYNEAHPKAPVIEEILHTGQHYDEGMSRVFFDELRIPEPAVNLNVGSGSHGAMTARMLEGIEREILARQPNWVLVYGDTNSTLAGALAAVKLHVPVAHVEAGLRSFNRRMPEEINRVVADHVATLLFCPTQTAIANLAREGITRGVHHVGDVMRDAATVFGAIAQRQSAILRDLDLRPKGYLLATVHREENTDDPARLRNIMTAFEELAQTQPVVFPVHPRTQGRLDGGAARRALGQAASGLRLIAPVSFLDMIQLEQNARVILTDSGGVQKEACFHGVPCVTLRAETEWVETVGAGWNQVAGTDPAAIVRAARSAAPGRPIAEYGSGQASEIILNELCRPGAAAGAP